MTLTLETYGYSNLWHPMQSNIIAYGLIRTCRKMTSSNCLNHSGRGRMLLLHNLSEGSYRINSNEPGNA